MPKFKDSYKYVIDHTEWQCLAPMLAAARRKYIKAWKLECALFGKCPLWNDLRAWPECISGYNIGRCSVILSDSKDNNRHDDWATGSYACGPRFVYRYMRKELIKARKEMRKNGKTTDDRQIPHTPQDYRGVQAGV